MNIKTKDQVYYQCLLYVIYLFDELCDRSLAPACPPLVIYA